MPDLTAQDARLLSLLQQDAKRSTQDLADAAGMSASPAWRRVRKLESDGVIDRTVALLNPRKLGLNTLAYVHVSLMDHSEASIRAFDSFVAREDQIVECCSITGADDYLLKVVAPDPEALETFLMRRILALGIVRSSTTHFVLRQKKHVTALPLDLG
ncbi:Lrp/AsnC family transcriptional regulator [Aliiroseovarius subalbicans]|uniref:Lrp/AsnC family transcriptional regulator n=1 Tax=Aliiroseovarius subalbicans TaxID=2925840 RepID=UPI001F5756B2|nr:Lrp/AsnC family transcriptional regulator [Aliiroseovarius subalbicans]MCI2398719.1 Lrp/AsnC family transcriptional regulator [Aliiroseovarius subalbicans]